MISGGVEIKVSRLESIVEQIGEAVLTTTETIESLADRLDHLSMQVEAQGKQLQQQGHQIFALCDTLQNLAQSQDYTVQKLTQLTYTLDKLTSLMQRLDAEGAKIK
ncbi:hypothetical protein NIES2109_34220 [Nostoc sp. HK-01]|uniref:Uncharacterized protein n=2 Tax=Nostocales TaxID=1161 RepID=A0A1Z4GD49_9CYAN|nr:hypothetical protein [Nostoc cycadae]BAY15266.1 hypothetical protein NIES21_10810 [Anabaenopsis circularis NIES-21]BBD60623.1 hypothetical protein NIES2109_34220 [Nostoc sp. HK-01]GBE94514.1 hypothetical protein NCWK1_4291 [Nostoc cycadae WK-1]